MLSSPFRKIGAIVVCVLAVPALASAESVQITNVSPTGVIAPGTSVNFIVSSTGFMNPSYAISDSVSAAGSTAGTIDQVGYFSWTPTIYDAGQHTLTITATDAYKHAASSTVSILVASTVVLVNNLTPGPIVSVGNPVSFTLMAPGFITPKYTVYDTAWRSSITPINVDASGLFTWTPTIDDKGTHTLNITASDPYGRHAETVQSLTIVQPDLSISNLSAGTSVAVGSTVSFRATAAMLASTTVYSISDSFTGTSTVSASSMTPSGVMSWVPAASDIGLHTLTVTAKDSYGNTASKAVMLLVTPGPATSATPTAAAGASAAPAPTTVPSTTAQAKPSAFLFTKNIAIGSGGVAVTALQNRLTALGYYTGPVTGYFGTMTAASVRKFQKANGLAQVGFVGPGTRAALNK